MNEIEAGVFTLPYFCKMNKHINAFKYVVLLVVFLSLFNGCMSIEKATYKVINDTKATNIILALHPCTTAIDSVVNHSDTLLQHDTTISTIFFTDTLHHWRHDTTTRTITNTRTIHDTTTHYKIDQRTLDAMNSTLQDAGKTIASLQQKVIDKDATIKDENKWLWLFIAAIVAFCLSNAVWIYSKFKV